MIHHMGVWTVPISATLNFRRRMTVKLIQQTVAQFYGINEEYMIAKSKEPRIVRPRWMAMYLARQLTPMSYPELGRRFGGKDHSTVIHGVRRMEQLIQSDPYLAMDVEVLKENLGA